MTQQLTPAAVAQGTEKAGQSNGRAIIASNPASLVATSNMSEEATALVANHKKASDFKVSKGKTESERQLELIEKIKIVEEIQGVDDFKRRFPEDSKQDYRHEDYLKGAKEQFKDPYHQYVALYELAVDFKAQPDDEVFQAIETLEQEHPKYIEVGVEISKAAGLLAEKYDGVSYTEINQKVFGHVKDHKSLSEAFKDLNNKQESTEFETNVDIRLKLLSSDLNKMTSTTEDTHLRSVINDMTTLKRLVGIHDTCMEAQGEMRRPPNSVEQFDGKLYMTKFLDILDKQFVVGSDFVTLLDQMGMSDQTIQAKTALINKTATLIRDIPEEVFANEQIKGGLVAAIGEEQDSLALIEEGGWTSDKEYGKVGEKEVNLDGFIRSGDILGDLGVNVTGAQANPIPDLVPTQDTAVSPLPDLVPTQDTAVSPLPDLVPTQDTAVSPLPDLVPSQDTAVSPMPDIVPTQKAQVEASGTVDKVSAGSAKNTTAEVSAKGSIDGLPDKELIKRQDELLDKARGLQEKKDTDFVYGCAVTGLEHALNNDPDTLSALSAVAKKRGKGTFAQGLKIAITPEGSGKELKLIPPDKEALRAWQAQNPDKSVADLVQTAIDVLKNNRDSGFDLEKINNELASLKGAISDIDSRIRKSHYTKSLKNAFKNPRKEPLLRQPGVDTFDNIESSHKFRIRADQRSVGEIKAEADTPEKNGVAAQKEKVDAASKDQQIEPVMGNQWRMPTYTGFDNPSVGDITPFEDKDGDGYMMDD
ncbi:TyeA family type III secretion system gatekeeper subunit [Endozoicomonas elysicola]|uniref:TyeA family type III secretion system gatekeeper subunit n=1 Tax=Endozoicomonas elysicola TaxID=305900 RepID=UPI001F1B4922|nr:TyeA family type III secretion system gatekeeper subunit [Endozoicomonas elysicola]